jgi:hypothetical protein
LGRRSLVDNDCKLNESHIREAKGTFRTSNWDGHKGQVRLWPLCERLRCCKVSQRHQAPFTNLSLDDLGTVVFKAVSSHLLSATHKVNGQRNTNHGSRENSPDQLWLM